jgi:hypothetical protein
MAALKQGQTLTKEDLNVYFYIGGSLSDPYWVTYTLFDSTSGKDEIIGLPERIPLKFGVGSYFAPWTVPDDEPVGIHKIRWKYKDTATANEKQDVEEFQIIPLCAGTGLVYPVEIMYLIQHLRNKLRDSNPDRDYSIAGEEKITVIADGKQITLSIKKLYEIVYGKLLNKDCIKKAFEENKLLIKSCSLNGEIQYRNIVDVLRHETISKDIYNVKIKSFVNFIKYLLFLQKPLKITEDHNLFVLKNDKLEPVKPDKTLNKIVVLKNNKLQQVDVKIKKTKKRKYMYDLSVEINHNFLLENNILVCNSFSPPTPEQTIAGFTKTRGFRWSDDSLYMHLVQACNYINLIPPDTAYTLGTLPGAWQPLVLLQAMTYALYDLAILWMNEEFTYNLNGISLDIMRSDKYMSAAQTIQSQVDSQLTDAKRRLHYMVGLRQSRYVMTYGGFFGPWTSGRMSIKKWVLGFGTQTGKGFN